MDETKKQRTLWGCSGVALVAAICFVVFGMPVIRKFQLRRAVVNNDVETARLLIDRGVSPVESWWAKAHSSLHTAAFGGRIEIVEHIIDLGFDIDSKSYDGTTPLALAARGEANKTLLYLIDKGADVNVMYNFATVRFASPLHRYVNNEDKKILEKLLRAGANPNVVDERGMTPLHFSVYSMKFDGAELLLKHGADPTIKDNHGKVPSDHCSPGQKWLKDKFLKAERDWTARKP